MPSIAIQLKQVPYENSFVFTASFAWNQLAVCNLLRVFGKACNSYDAILFSLHYDDIIL